MSIIYLAPSSPAEQFILARCFSQSECASYRSLIIIAFAALAIVIFLSAILSYSFWIKLCFLSMEDLLAGIFTFRGLLFHWFFVLSLLVSYSSTQKGKRHFSLFEERILTDLEAEINLVNFHIRGIGLGRILTSSV